jgi:hypothetical protein
MHSCTPADPSEETLNLEGYYPRLEDQYQIQCTKEQVAVIRDALELWARISNGQIQEILTPFSNMPLEFSEEIRRLSRQIEIKMREILPTNPSSKHGVVSKYGDLSWEMFQTLRHRLSWDKVNNPPERNWKTMWSVDYDEPLKITEVPLVNIRKL